MVEIREIRKSEYDDLAKNVVREGLGTTYSENIQSLNESDPVLLIAETNGMIVGFACGYNSDGSESYIGSIEMNTDANSILEKIAVLPEYRGQGIGKELCQERLKRLDKPTIAESWVRTDSPDSTILLEQFGFDRIETIENKWYEESIRSQNEDFCPDCGRICRCDSAVYILENFTCD